MKEREKKKEDPCEDHSDYLPLEVSKTSAGCRARRRQKIKVVEGVLGIVA
jgi:hypothetical protein